MPGFASTDGETTTVVPVVGATGDAADGHAVGLDPGLRIGRYVVIEELGRGGMGLVLRAYDPKLQREVALKLLKTALLDASGQARLVREARAMARLSHPNVVAVYDVDVHDVAHDGVVIVMEYVPGSTLHAWLEAATRSPAEIIEAFVAAGKGLACAHAENLLHRDFKLDNVLVGNDARVRVTDFGLARGSGSFASSEEVDVASSDGPHSSTRSSSSGVCDELTEAGLVMGTPLYMAPEQLQGGVELDARADQYAFCVALWRALSGSWPYEGREGALLEAKRAGVPPWPSNVAMSKHITEALRRGLSPQPADRWPTLEALLRELSRAPSRRRRHLASIGALSVLGLGIWAWQLVDRARTQAACAAEGERITEVWNDDRADAIGAAFDATGIVYAADTWDRSRTRLQIYAEAWQAARTRTCEHAEIDGTLAPELAWTARACLDEHRDRLEALLEGLSQPDAKIVQLAATATASMPSLESCTDETALRRRAEPPWDPRLRDQVAVLRSRLAAIAAVLATGRYAEALVMAQAVLEEASALSLTPIIAEARYAVGLAYEGQGEYEAAREAQESAFFEAGSAGDDELAMKVSTALVFVTGDLLARHDEGLHWGRVSQMLARRLGRSDDLMLANLLGNLGNLHETRGAYDEALELQERSLAIKVETHGWEHFEVAVSLNNLGNVHSRQGNYDKALQAHERALEIRESSFGREHPEVALSLNNLGNAYMGRADFPKALEFYERARAVWEKTLNADHPNIAMSLHNICIIRSRRGEYDDALELCERARAIWEKALGPEHPRVAAVLNVLGGVLSQKGERAQALELFDKSLAIREKALGPDHSEVAASLLRLGNEHLAAGHHAVALESLTRALGIWEEALGPDHPFVAAALESLGSTHSATGAHAEAAEAYERALAIRERGDHDVSKLASTRFRLAKAMYASGRDRPRARELAIAAADAQRSLGADGANALDEMQAWLASHPAR